MQNPLPKLWVGIALLFLPFNFLLAQNTTSFWEISNHNQTLLRAASPMKTLPTVYQPFQLNNQQMLEVLMEEAPPRFSDEAQNPQYEVQIPLPMPDGTTANFKLLKFSVMAKGLANKYPNIRTYTAIGIDDPTAMAKIDITPKGFHAMILAPGKSPIYIDPLVAQQNQYISYDRKDFPIKGNGIQCQVVEDENQIQEPIISSLAPIGDCQFRQYRLALACTGEYAQFHDDGDDTNGDIISDVLAAMATSMNRVNGVFEQDAGITMEIVANNDLIIFTDADTDPYDNGDGGAMLGQNQTTCNNLIGTNNYDIGHVYSTGGGGVAYLRSPCGGNKAGGVTGQGSPIGDPFDIDYVAHEMGHQFGGNHTQNNSCNRSSASVEPGSASTIMGYAGICAPNVQNNSDAYFHGVTLAEFAAFVTGSGNSCANILSSSNNTPTAEAGNNYTIPISTPFELTAVGFDPDGDPITYCWEQMDNEAGEDMPPEPSNTQGPNFRSYTPTLDPVRTFPNLNTLLFGGSNEWEVLPGVQRSLNFTINVRDNNSGYGCVAKDEMIVTTTPSAGPFVVTSPTTPETWEIGETQTITWDVANTNLAPVSCSEVDILISTDGGFNFSNVATNQANNGAFDFVVPNIESPDVRFKIICSNNIFFAITPQAINIGYTETCNVFNSTDLPIAISEDGQPLITSELEINLGETIASVKVVNLTGEHTYTGDLDFTLIHPNGQEISLLNDECDTDEDFNLEISDSGGAVNCPLSDQQTVAPTEALSTLNGLTTDGVWVLQVQDDADADGGILNSWGLEICYSTPLSALPVELVEFKATAQDKQIQLNWETSSERDNDGFEIMRSTQPTQGFRSIGWVDGFGTNDGHQYGFSDREVKSGVTYYYQLKQIDYDEQFELSKIASARLTTDDPIVEIRPNPAHDQLTLTLALEGTHTARYSIMDLLGRKVLETATEFTNLSTQNFTINQLTKGVYFLRIELESGEQLIQKFVKE